jgi:hypothetical protein
MHARLLYATEDMHEDQPKTLMPTSMAVGGSLQTKAHVTACVHHTACRVPPSPLILHLLAMLWCAHRPCRAALTAAAATLC